MHATSLHYFSFVGFRENSLRQNSTPTSHDRSPCWSARQQRKLEVGAGMAKKKAQMGFGVGEVVAVVCPESDLGSRWVVGQDRTKCSGAFS